VLNLQPLVSIMPLEKVKEAFVGLIKGQGIKVLLKP
jgi:hypothetical protein